jgi:hypothetical protein
MSTKPDPAADLFAMADEVEAPPLFLTGLSIKDYRKIREVDMEFTPQGGLIVVRGPNESGKTTFARAAFDALANRENASTANIRHGEHTAEVVVKLGTLTARRVWKKNKRGPEETTTLHVTDEHGEKVAGPQGVLDALLDRVALDPIAWAEKGLRGAAEKRAQMDDLIRAVRPVAPVEEVAKALGSVNIAPPQTEHPLDLFKLAGAKVVEKRRDLGRSLEAAEAKVKALAGAVGGAPTKPPTPQELAAADAKVREARAAASEWKAAQERLIRARDELAAAEKASTAAQARDVAAGDAAEHEKALDALKVAAASAQVYAQHEAAKSEAARLETAHAAVDEVVKRLDDLRVEMLAGATMPLEDLAFGEDGLVYKGLPFPENASGEERITVGLHVAAAANPRLRLLRVDDGNKLDTFHREHVRRFCEERGYQIILVMVDDDPDGPGGGIFIQDGAVVNGDGAR